MPDNNSLGTGGLLNALGGINSNTIHNQRSHHTAMMSTGDGRTTANAAAMTSQANGARARPNNTSTSSASIQTTANLSAIANSNLNSNQRQNKMDMNTLKFMDAFAVATNKLDKSINRQSAMLERNTASMISRLESINKTLLNMNEILSRGFQANLEAFEESQRNEIDLNHFAELFAPRVTKMFNIAARQIMQSISFKDMAKTFLEFLGTNSTFRKLFRYDEYGLQGATDKVVPFTKQISTSITKVIPQGLSIINETIKSTNVKLYEVALRNNETTRTFTQESVKHYKRNEELLEKISSDLSINKNYVILSKEETRKFRVESNSSLVAIQEYSRALAQNYAMMHQRALTKTRTEMVKAEAIRRMENARLAQSPEEKVKREREINANKRLLLAEPGQWINISKEVESRALLPNPRETRLTMEAAMTHDKRVKDITKFTDNELLGFRFQGVLPTNINYRDKSESAKLRSFLTKIDSEIKKRNITLPTTRVVDEARLQQLAVQNLDNKNFQLAYNEILKDNTALSPHLGIDSKAITLAKANSKAEVDRSISIATNVMQELQEVIPQTRDLEKEREKEKERQKKANLKIDKLVTSLDESIDAVNTNNVELKSNTTAMDAVKTTLGYLFDSKRILGFGMKLFKWAGIVGLGNTILKGLGLIGGTDMFQSLWSGVKTYIWNPAKEFLIDPLLTGLENVLRGWIGDEMIDKMKSAFNFIVHWGEIGFNAYFGASEEIRQKNKTELFDGLKSVISYVMKDVLLPSLTKIISAFYGYRRIANSVRKESPQELWAKQMVAQQSLDQMHAFNPSGFVSAIRGLPSGLTPTAQLKLLSNNPELRQRTWLGDMIANKKASYLNNNNGQYLNNGFLARTYRAGRNISSTWSDYTSGAKETWGMVGELSKVSSKFMVSISSWMSNIISKLFSATSMIYVVRLALGSLTSIFGRFGTDTKSKGSIVGTVSTFITDLFVNVKKSLFGDAGFKDVLGMIGSGILGLFKGVVNGVLAVFEASSFSDIIISMGQGMVYIIQGIWDWLKNEWDDLSSRKSTIQQKYYRLSARQELNEIGADKLNFEAIRKEYGLKGISNDTIAQLINARANGSEKDVKAVLNRIYRENPKLKNDTVTVANDLYGLTGFESLEPQIIPKIEQSIDLMMKKEQEDSYNFYQSILSASKHKEFYEYAINDANRERMTYQEYVKRVAATNKTKDTLKKEQEEPSNAETPNTNTNDESKGIVEQISDQLGKISEFFTGGDFMKNFEEISATVGAKLGTMIGNLKGFDYGGTATKLLDGLGGMTGSLLSGIFGDDRASNYLRSMQSFAEKNGMSSLARFAKRGQFSIYSQLDDISKFSQTSNILEADIKKILEEGVANGWKGKARSGQESGLTPLDEKLIAIESKKLYDKNLVLRTDLGMTDEAYNSAKKKYMISGDGKSLAALGTILGSNAEGVKISSSFGKARSIFGGTSIHRGVDITSSSANPGITAAFGGEVLFAGAGKEGHGIADFGRYVEIYNKEGNFTTVYGHLDSVSTAAVNALKNKTSLSPGEALGIMGSTGRSTGRHLHFGVYSGRGINPNRALDPEEFLNMAANARIKAGLPAGMAQNGVDASSESGPKLAALKPVATVFDRVGSTASEVTAAKAAIDIRNNNNIATDYLAKIWNTIKENWSNPHGLTPRDNAPVVINNSNTTNSTGVNVNNIPASTTPKVKKSANRARAQSKSITYDGSMA